MSKLTASSTGGDATGSSSSAGADAANFSPTDAPAKVEQKCPKGGSPPSKITVYRRMSDKEAEKTLADGKLQGPVKGSNGKKYLSESQGKAADFDNKKVAEAEKSTEKVVAFDMDKEKYDAAMADSVAQKDIQGNADNKKKIETHYEGLHEDAANNPHDLKNIGVPPEKLDAFNDAVLAVRDVTDESNAMDRGPEVKPKKAK